MTFDGTADASGTGGYTLTGQGITHAVTATGGFNDQSPLPVAASGRYSVKSSGWIVLTNPFDPAGQAWMQGGMAIGGDAILASSGGWNFYDMLVGIPASGAASKLSNATLNGNYYVASMGYWTADSLLGTNEDSYGLSSTFFPMTADGNAGLGNLSVESADGTTTQSIAGATYTVNSDGTGTLHLPPPARVPDTDQLLAGDKVLYLSGDGGFFIAGGSSAYEMIFGARMNPNPNTDFALSGTYFRLCLKNAYGLPQRYGIMSSVGAVTEVPSLKLEVVDEWDVTTNWGNYDMTSSQDFTFGANFTKTDASSGENWAANYNSEFVIGSAGDSDYSVSLRVMAPDMSQVGNLASGPFLNPQGIVNAANYAPFTSNVAPGEMIFLPGNGLGPTQAVTASGSSWPTTLAGVRSSWREYRPRCTT
jgi:hypothetical protein